MLTRLRQIALHPDLVPANYLESLLAQAAHDNMDEQDPSGPVKKVTASESMRLKDLLRVAIEDNEECPICFDILSRTTSCFFSVFANCYC